MSNLDTTTGSLWETQTKTANVMKSLKIYLFFELDSSNF